MRNRYMGMRPGGQALTSVKVLGYEQVGTVTGGFGCIGALVIASITCALHRIWTIRS